MKVEWQWEWGHSRSPVGGILYLDPSHAEVPCSDLSHLTSTVGERKTKLRLVSQFYKHNTWVSLWKKIRLYLLHFVPNFINVFMHFKQADTTNTRPHNVLNHISPDFKALWSDQTSLCPVKNMCHFLCAQSKRHRGGWECLWCNSYYQKTLLGTEVRENIVDNKMRKNKSKKREKGVF